MAWSTRRKWCWSIAAALLLAICLAARLIPRNDDDEEVRGAFERVQIGMSPTELHLAVYPGDSAGAASAAIGIRPGDWLHMAMPIRSRLSVSVIPFKVESSWQQSPGRLRVHFDKNLKVDAKRIESRAWWFDMLLQSIGM
jgi:hypothetical protein